MLPRLSELAPVLQVIFDVAIVFTCVMLYYRCDLLVRMIMRQADEIGRLYGHLETQTKFESQCFDRIVDLENRYGRDHA